MIWRLLSLPFQALWFRRSPKRLAGYLGSDADSEAVAEVVRVTEILPHGNADKLEVAKFELKSTGPSGYECIVQKGQFQVGDLAGYLGVDCVVPVSGPFSFLGTRLDGVGKSHYRLRAARLRGRYSQGLLIKAGECGDVRFGDLLWEKLGVDYHRAPEPGQSTPGQAPRRVRPQPILQYDVLSLKKVPNLFEGCPQLFVTEKIHGSNIRFGWIRRRVLGIPVGWRFVVGSHRVIKTDDPSPGWYGEDVWSEFATRNRLAERTAHLKGFVFFGELYGHTYGGKRIQDMTYGRSPEQGPGLFLFDVLERGKWQDPEERWETCRSIGLPMVPVIHVTTPETDIVALAEGTSLVRTAPLGHIREGVVVESIGVTPRRKAKYVGQGYYLRKDA